MPSQVRLFQRKERAEGFRGSDGNLLASNNARRLVCSSRISQQRNPLCTAGYSALGASVGFWAGGGLGLLGLAGGPAALATVPGGAAGGTAIGGGVGGLGGMVMCSSGTWGGSGGGGKSKNQKENEDFDLAVKEIGKKIGKALDKDKMQRLHRAISKKGYDFDDRRNRRGNVSGREVDSTM